MIKSFAPAILAAIASASYSEMAEDLVNAFEEFWITADVNADDVVTKDEFVTARSAIASLPNQATMTLDEAIQAEYSFYLGERTELRFDMTLETLLEKVVPKVATTYAFSEDLRDASWEQGSASRDEFNEGYPLLLRDSVDDALKVFLETQRDAVFDFYDLDASGSLEFAEVCLRQFQEDGMQLICYDVDPANSKDEGEEEEEEVDEAAELFGALDLNGDGFVDFDELEETCPQGEWAECEFKMVVTDPDDDGRVTLDDLRAAIDMVEWTDQNWDIIRQTLFIWDAEEGGIPRTVDKAEFYAVNIELHIQIGLPKLSRAESDAIYDSIAGEDNVLSLAEMTRHYMSM